MISGLNLEGRQSGAAEEGVGVQLVQGGRQADPAQRGAVLKGAGANPFDRVCQAHVRQIREILQRAVAYGADAAFHNNVFNEVIYLGPRRFF